MSNSILPHLLSDSPPPLIPDDEDFEDEFGDFKGPGELSFDNDNPSTPSSLKNSKDYFPDTYANLNIENVEKYQIYNTATNKSPTNIINSLPSDNYFSIWNQIENNIPVVNDENDDDQVEIRESKNSEELANDEKKSTCVVNDFSSEINVVELQSKPIPVEINSQHENSLKYIYGNADEEFSSKENIHLPKTEKFEDIQIEKLKVDENKGEETKVDDVTMEEDKRKERIEINDFHSSESISNHVIYNNYSELRPKEADCDLPIKLDLDSVENSSMDKIYSGQEEKCSESDDFGEFADFSSCTTEINNILTKKPENTEENNGDSFQAFGSFRNVKPMTESVENNEDSSQVFGNLQNLKTSTESVVNEENSFQEFGSFQNVKTSAEMVENTVNVSEEFQSFQNVKMTTDSVEHNEDSFHEFGSFQNVKTCVDSIENNEDSCPEFGSFQNVKTSTDNAENDEDGFQDFGSFQNVKTSADSVENNEDSCPEFRSFQNVKTSADSVENNEDSYHEFGSFQNVKNSTDNAENDEDGFQEFGSFQNVKSSADSVENNEDSYHEFGSFQNVKNSTDNVENDEDGFQEFGSFQNVKSNADSVENNEDSFQEFGRFQNVKSSADSVEKNEDSFQEFGSFQNVKTTTDSVENDEFDDFTCYSTQNSDDNSVRSENSSDGALKICKTPEEAHSEAQNVLKKIFPMNECSTPEYSNCDYIMNSFVFENLKEITETNALTYQWGKSVAQKNILKTLNIDIRNILYGPSWNSGVPLFAANLCSKPLEPIRTEVPPSTSNKPTASQESTSVTPQFDWTASGLANLQDSAGHFQEDPPSTDVKETSKTDTEVLHPSYEELVPTPIKSNKFEDDLSQFEQFDDSKKEKFENDDFSDFTSYREIEEESKWKNMLPLRESHISSDSSKENSETNKTSSYLGELTMERTEENKEMLTVFNNDAVVKSKEEQTFGMNNYDYSMFETKKKEEEVKNSVKHQEDEFTDFQSSLPCSSRPATKTVLLEPLKPSILTPQPVKDEGIKIEWPEPGLDEQEINRIVDGVLRKNSTGENLQNEVNTKPNDQDDWSDFISVKEPSKSRNSTPDLPLSVFNLGNIQPNKISAPYISPNGVVHSPSKTPSISFPINRSLQSTTQQYSHQIPFITSQVFNQLNAKDETVFQAKPNNTQLSFDSFGVNYSPRNEVLDERIKQNATATNVEEDDWGDFVSAPKTTAQSNSFQTAPYPNFAFNSVSATVPQASNKNNVKKERNDFQFLSTMPDLDFVSPKSRSTVK